MLPSNRSVLPSDLKMHIGQRIFQAVGQPNAKVGQPEDIANAVSYLVSPAAHFITGEARDPMLRLCVLMIITRPDCYHRRRNYVELTT